MNDRNDLTGYSDAQSAVRSLEATGVPHSDISIVANNSDNWFSTDKKGDRDRDGIDDRAEGAGLGGAAGLLAGLGLLAVPGLGGPVVAAGWLAATLSVRQPVLPREGLWKL